MAPVSSRDVLTIDNDEDDVTLGDKDADLEILEHGTSLVAGPSLYNKPSIPDSLASQTFRKLDWDPTQLNMLASGSSSRSPSPASTSYIPMSISGTANKPIELHDEPCHDEMMRRGPTSSARPNKKTRNSYSTLPRSGVSPHRIAILLDDDSNKPQSRAMKTRPSALERSLKRKPTQEDELIDLDDLEEEKEWLRLEHVYDQEPATNQRKSSKTERRNPSIMVSSAIREEYLYKGGKLRPNKSVELKDGSFLRIKCILVNEQTAEVRLRGHSIFRTKDANGMLEKKMNEALLFYEVDLDDPRQLSEQSVVDVPLHDVVKFRNVRLSNQRFPFYRNVDRTHFNNDSMMFSDGGLTVRWKYTCTYASSQDRLLNKFAERALERLRAEECSREYTIPDADSRFLWRGETIPGGAYQPTIQKEEKDFQDKKPSFNTRDTPDGDASDVDDCVLIPIQMIEEANSKTEDYKGFVVVDLESSRVGKRKQSQADLSSFQEGTSKPYHGPKRYHQDTDSVEQARKGVSKITLLERNEFRKNSKPIDLSEDMSSGISLSSSQTINLISPDFPDKGVAFPTRHDQHPKVCMVRTAGQKLTYGDAFCGAGGTTRGAFMAGLRVKWGFDMWDSACETWSANFPWAKCYQKASHEFVDLANCAKAAGLPDLMKVDVLHLSPPCQYWSPAHTIDGANDEMNIASLFAVQSVLEVSRPRIATLEQTFGIAVPRFLFYFNALINMFTTLNFSVRWSIIPLAQWGLPQRRNRLIIIASCPGEILPKMPSATHSEGGVGGTKPFVSVNETLAKIPANAPCHNLESVKYKPHQYQAPYEGDRILPHTMTTSGGQNYHPSGMRGLTLAEYAALQGFPPGHRFVGHAIKKQIGNSVPPCAAKVLFQSIKKDLDGADGIVEDMVLID